MMTVLAAAQPPITPQLRRAVDTMLEVLGQDRGGPGWEALQGLNYGAYWKAQYGY
jgi:hypothetical protein